MSAHGHTPEPLRGNGSARLSGAPALTLRFADCELDFARSELRREGALVALQPTPLRVLLYLAEHRDRVVSRVELLDTIWPGVVVGDEALTTALAEARHAAGDDGAAQRVIRTHKGRGYRFVAEVVAGADEPVRGTEPARVMLATRWTLAAVAITVVAIVAAFEFGNRARTPPSTTETAAPAHAALTPIRSLAVLPLTNLSGDPEQEYYADGMTETLIAELAKLPGVRVVSRTSVMQFKRTSVPLPEIAKQLNVDGVIEGSVMRAENRVRITAQLIDARGDRQVWAEQYDRELARVFEIQGEVARAVAGQIALALTPEQGARLAPRKPVDPRAQEAYFRGLALRARDYDAALRSFEQAVQLAPEFAPAWAALSRAHAVSCVIGCVDPSGAGSRAREAADRAIALDATLADSHVAMGWVHTLFDWNWEAAERELRRAAELSSVDFGIGPSLAWNLLITDRREEALAEYDRWLANAPDTLETRVFQQNFLRDAGRIEEAFELTTRALEGDPENPAMLYFQAENLFSLGRHADAIPILKRALPAMMNFSAQDAAEVERSWRAGSLDGYSRAWEGIDSRYGRWVSAACCALVRGDHEAALGDLERAFETRDPHLRLLTVSDCLAPLHSDPRFADLARRMKLPLQVLPKGAR